jgi:hypothetical protein
MNRAVALAAVFLSLLTILGARSWQTVDPDQSASCKMVQGALRASRDIKIGSTRRELENNWSLDGGTELRDEGRYNYRGCGYIQVDVKFKLAAPTDQTGDLPDDTVTHVSRPNLAYPRLD